MTLLLKTWPNADVTALEGVRTICAETVLWEKQTDKIHSSKKKNCSFFFFSFEYVLLLALVLEFNSECFLRSRCSMEMWCPDDVGRDGWDGDGPPTWERAWFNSPGSSPVKKGALSRLDCCCCWCVVVGRWHPNRTNQKCEERGEVGTKSIGNLRPSKNRTSGCMSHTTPPV